MNINEIKETYLCIQYKEARKSIVNVTEGGVWWLSGQMSWTKISMIPGALNYLSGELAIGAFGNHKTIWFATEDPLLGVSKPVTVVNIGLTANGDYLLEVIGQQSDRIKKKWEAKYTQRMRGNVTLVWKEDTREA